MTRWMWAVLVVTACVPEPELIDCAPADADNILDQRGAYYACLDAALGDGEGCGSAGYPLGYGHKYVERFLLETYDQVSPEGQAFLEAAGVCLQTRMAEVATDATTCDQVWTLGFESHPDCYFESGFCALTLSDVAAVAGALDASDRSLPEQQAQSQEIIALCGSR